MNVVARTLALFVLAIAANTASAEALTERSINDLIATMDESIRARNAEGVGKLLSTDFRLTHEINAYGQKQTIKADKSEYMSMLKQSWAIAAAYKYERSQVKITLAPGNASARVTARIQETITVQGQSVSATSIETATVKLIDGRPFFTDVIAVMGQPTMQ